MYNAYISTYIPLYRNGNINKNIECKSACYIFHLVSSPFVCFYCSCKFQMVFCCMRHICVCVKDLNQSKHKSERTFCDYTRQPTFRRLLLRESLHDQSHAFICAQLCDIVDIDIISFKIRLQTRLSLSLVEWWCVTKEKGIIKDREHPSIFLHLDIFKVYLSDCKWICFKERRRRFSLRRVHISPLTSHYMPLLIFYTKIHNLPCFDVFSLLFKKGDARPEGLHLERKYVRIYLQKNTINSKYSSSVKCSTRRIYQKTPYV